MSSREIADFTGKRHDNVRDIIRRLAERYVISLPDIQEKQTAGRPAIEYVFSGELGERDSIIVVAQLSPELTAHLVDRWQELEQKAAAAIPDFSDPVASARAWADAKESEQASLIHADHLREETLRLNTVCNDLADNLKDGLTPAEFCRMLNGINLNRVQPDLVERKRLLKTEHAYPP